MSNELPYLIWQREYGRRWTVYTYDEMCIINKAVKKKQKTVTLPSNDPQRKINVTFESMIQKNLVSGFEQRVRCLIFNDSYFCWSWKDDHGDMISFTPRITFLLEVAFEKKLDKFDFFLRDEYEIDLLEFTQRNKETGFIRPISRDKVDIKMSKENAENSFMVMKHTVACKDLVKEKAAADDNSFKSYAFDLPVPASDSEATSISLLPMVPDKIITALNAEVKASTSRRTSVPVDPDCSHAKDYRVYSENGDPYDATLNLTSVQANSNKFFIMQLLIHIKKNKYAVWFHWGRVGYKGQTNFIDCGNNLEKAKLTFEKKFYDKTLNQWREKDDFQRNPAKYDLIYTEHLSKEQSVQKLIIPASKLDKRIQALLQIICDKKNLEEVAKEFGFDTNRSPLGKITARQVKDGYAALSRVATLVQNKIFGKELVAASDNFYTKIPHDFKRQTPPLINSKEDIERKLEMLEELSHIVLAMDVLSSSAEHDENIIDKYYKRLECELIPLDSSSEEFQVLNKCLLETHGPTHSSYTMELIDAFKCVKNYQEPLCNNFGNKKLLWHGSRISNWISILKTGLKIAPPNAPSTGFMFGKGIYFADVSSKSANYCFATQKHNEGLLLLSEVTLGNALTATEAKDHSNLPDEFHSVFGIGRIRPREFTNTILSSEATLPCGPLVVVKDEKVSLIYNEYVVYKVEQVKMQYLLRIRFNYVK